MLISSPAFYDILQIANPRKFNKRKCVWMHLLLFDSLLKKIIEYNRYVDFQLWKFVFYKK